ncbi:hypothetical protein LINGRAHAP2_LOCUS22407, partial [Linum grandiflorum]
RYGSFGAGVVLPLNQGDVVHLPVVEATQNPTDHSRKESLKEPMQGRQRVDFALPEVSDVGGQYAGVLHLPIRVEAMELKEVQKTLGLLNVQITSLQNVTQSLVVMREDLLARLNVLRQPSSHIDDRHGGDIDDGSKNSDDDGKNSDD